jgi:hypothetical protein
VTNESEQAQSAGGKATEEPSIRVIDRRLLSEEERAGKAAAPDPEVTHEPASEPAGADEAASAAGETTAQGADEQGDEAQLPDPSVDDILSLAISMLAAHAWQKIGLQASPATGRIDKDLGEARVAIDSLEPLVEQLVKRVPPREANELRAVLSNLRVNYVQQSSASD